MDAAFVFLLLLTEVILFVFSYILFNGDLVSPSVVTLGLFILSTICYAYNINEWIIVFTIKGYLLFTLSFILMIVTERWVSKYKLAIKIKWKKNNIIGRSASEKRLLYLSPNFDTLLFVFFCFCSFFYIFRVYKSGMNLGAAGLLSSIGYNKENGEYDSFSRLLYNITRMSSYVYVIIFCNNVICCKQRIKENWRELVIILLTILITFFSGQRSSSICYIAGIVVACGISLYDAQKSGNKVNIKKFISKIVLLAIAIVLAFYLSSNIVKGTNVQRKFVDYLTYYFGSTTALMGRIIEEPSLCHTPFSGYFGEKTFNGFWLFLYTRGLIDSAPTERLWIKMGGSVATRAGNEYTFFCGPYIDFGFIGTLLFIMVFYAAFSYIYYWKIRKAEPTHGRYTISAIYIFLYAMVAMSFYQDTIRSYSRPINILYIIYIIVFSKLFLRLKKWK